MQEFVIRLWPGLAAALLLGLAICATGHPRRPLGLWRWLTAAIALGLLLAGTVLSALQLVSGAAGLWLDSAVLHAAGYLAGCGLGLLVSRTRRHRAGPQQA